MPVTRQRSKESAEEEVENEMIFVSKEESPPTEMEVQRKKLRQSWELASVLNFFNVNFSTVPFRLLLKLVDCII